MHVEKISFLKSNCLRLVNHKVNRSFETQNKHINRYLLLDKFIRLTDSTQKYQPKSKFI